MKDYIVGIDISTSKVCGVVGILDDDKKLEIIGITTYDCDGLKDKRNININNTSKVINNVITHLENIICEKISEVYFSVPISICEGIRVKGIVPFSEHRNITELDIKNVQEAMKFSVSKNSEIIEVKVEEYIVDDMKNIDNPLHMKARTFQADGVMFVAPKEVLEPLRQSIENTGLKIRGISVSAIGIAKDIIKKDEMDSGVVIIDMGASTTEVTIFKGNYYLDSFTIFLGGNTITNDISICLKISKDNSEYLKLKCSTLIKDETMKNHRVKAKVSEGKSIDVDYETLVDIIYERVREILELIKSNLVERGLYDFINNIVIVGGGISLFRDINLVAHDILNKNIRVGSPKYIGAANPIYSTATGILRNVSEKNEEFNEILKNERDIQPQIVKKNNNGIIAKLKSVFNNFSNEEVAK